MVAIGLHRQLRGSERTDDKRLVSARRLEDDQLPDVAAQPLDQRPHATVLISNRPPLTTRPGGDDSSALATPIPINMCALGSAVAHPYLYEFGLGLTGPRNCSGYRRLINGAAPANARGSPPRSHRTSAAIRMLAKSSES
jgi:hypothetical protein